MAILRGAPNEQYDAVQDLGDVTAQFQKQLITGRLILAVIAVVKSAIYEGSGGQVLGTRSSICCVPQGISWLTQERGLKMPAEETSQPPQAKAQNKCAHPACRCRAEKGSKYCSTYCHDAGSKMEIACNCGHDACVEPATKTA